MSKIQFKLDINKGEQKRQFKMPRLKFKKQLVVNKKKLVKHAVLFSILLTFVFVIGFLINNILPVAVTVDGEDICYMSQEEADNLSNSIALSYVPTGATLKAISSEGTVEIDKRFKLVPRSSYVSGEDAARLLEEALNQKENEGVKITTISSITSLEKYTPEDKLERNDKMLAGEEKVKKKGKDGTKNITRTYITVNREVESVEISKEEIVKQGKAAVVMRGTLGLPEGADWRTFDGEPEFHDGEAVATTALTYLGAPYKYGGKNLKTGIDCVWFVVRMYEKYGIELPANHPGLKSVGTGVSIEKAKKGDIVCYSKHVSIYLGDGKVVEASSHGGVRVGKLKEGRVVTIRRIVE